MRDGVRARPANSDVSGPAKPVICRREEAVCHASGAKSAVGFLCVHERRQRRVHDCHYRPRCRAMPRPFFSSSAPVVPPVGDTITMRQSRVWLLIRRHLCREVRSPINQLVCNNGPVGRLLHVPSRAFADLGTRANTRQKPVTEIAELPMQGCAVTLGFVDIEATSSVSFNSSSCSLSALSASSAVGTHEQGMDQTLKQVGELLLGAIPTAILLLLLYAIYRQSGAQAAEAGAERAS